MIGIVGGVGPLGGLDLYKKIIEETIALSDQEHLPVMLYSFPNLIGDRSEYLKGHSTVNPAIALAAITRQMESAGVTIVGIPCNTAHADPIYGVYEQELAKTNQKIKILHLVNETISYMKTLYSKAKVGILSTTGTRNSGLYRDLLLKEGFEIVEPSEDWQERIHAAIYDKEYGIKAQSTPVTNKVRLELHSAMDELKKGGAEIIVLGCTELPLALPENDHNGMTLIDPNRILARALIYAFSPDKLK
ncbi:MULTISPECIES: aspartate/glutamate racemase family protein [unclassified Sphingobacterium]|uniref:aspartate/glutamate racemase family protein n=1 Tax=unclassified Sphingobacterium TaxID=2609468 RepID=UPI001052ABDD|nr:MULTISPECIES: amino acid racemase [unclassified Sphingobacterium]MCS3556649.1 aspartate racemase [Sphingobacterium sp. JUb21]TCQ99471.1 aspartate racemase [Sphingobacterium sp. JUb20]